MAFSILLLHRPAASSLIFPLAWGLGQLFWSFQVILFDSFYFSPGGEIELCSSQPSKLSMPICTTSSVSLGSSLGISAFQHLFSTSSMMMGRTCHRPFSSSSLSCFPPHSRAPAFLDAGGHSQAQAWRKQPNPAHNRPFPAGEVSLGRLLISSQTATGSRGLACSSTLLMVMLEGCHGSSPLQAQREVPLEHPPGCPIQMDQWLHQGSNCVIESLLCSREWVPVVMEMPFASHLVLGFAAGCATSAIPAPGR